MALRAADGVAERSLVEDGGEVDEGAGRAGDRDAAVARAVVGVE